MWGLSWGSYICLSCLPVPAPFIEKCIFPPLSCFNTFVSNQLSIFVQVCFGFSVPFHWQMYISLLQYHSVYYCSHIINLKIGLFLPTFFFFKIILAHLIILPFYINFRIIFSVSTKNIAGILRWSMFNLCIIVGRMASLPRWVYQSMNTLSSPLFRSLNTSALLCSFHI